MRFDAHRGAELAKIKLSEEELEILQRDLDEIYEILKPLLEVDLEVDPMYTPSENLNVVREDVPGETLGESWLYMVPRVEEYKSKKYVKAPRP